jgi:hypothetical protein
MCCHGKFVTRRISYFASANMNIFLTTSVTFSITSHLRLSIRSGILPDRFRLNLSMHLSSPPQPTEASCYPDTTYCTN